MLKLKNFMKSKKNGYFAGICFGNVESCQTLLVFNLTNIHEWKKFYEGFL